MIGSPEHVEDSSGCDQQNRTRREYGHGSTSAPLIATEQENLKRRPYKFINRKPKFVVLSATRERWDDKRSAMTLQKLQNKTCYQKGGCLGVANGEFLLEQMNAILSLGAHSRREHFLLCWDPTVIFFDGRKVCSRFLLQSVHFSRKLQASVRDGSDFIS